MHKLIVKQNGVSECHYFISLHSYVIYELKTADNKQAIQNLNSFAQEGAGWKDKLSKLLLLFYAQQNCLQIKGFLKLVVYLKVGTVYKCL